MSTHHLKKQKQKTCKYDTVIKKGFVENINSDHGVVGVGRVGSDFFLLHTISALHTSILYEGISGSACTCASCQTDILNQNTANCIQLVTSFKKRLT